MPYALVPPKAGRSPFWRVRGTEFSIPIDRSTQTSDRRLAAKLLAQWRTEAQRLAVAPPDEKRGLTFASASIAYMNAGGEKRFLAPLLKHFREKALAKIDQAAIDAAAVALYPESTPATRNRQVYSPVSAILRHAGVIMPLRRPKGAHDGRRLDWLRQDQAFALLDAASIIHERFGALLKFLLYSGVRLSEALRLEWIDVDLTRAVALIRETKKTSRSRFTCPRRSSPPLHPWTVRSLACFALPRPGGSITCSPKPSAGPALNFHPEPRSTS